MRVWICYCLHSLLPLFPSPENISTASWTRCQQWVWAPVVFTSFTNRAHDSFFTKLFSREAADNKSSIFICNHRFPSRLVNALHINSSLVFTSQYDHREISSARSFVIISVDGGHSAPVCQSSTMSLTQIKAIWAPRLFTVAFILLFWHRVLVERQLGYVAQLCLCCSSEFGLISILVSIHNPACVSGDPMRRWSTMGRFPGRAEGGEGHCKRNPVSKSHFYHVSSLKIRFFIKQNIENNLPAGRTKLTCTFELISVLF